jgi:hypothetical protein
MRFNGDGEGRFPQPDESLHSAKSNIPAARALFRQT